MKVGSFNEALSVALPINNSKNIQIGKLVPVGNWILSDEEKIQNICDWRQKAMHMFLSQFESTYDRSLAYIKNLSIGQADRILFLIYDDNNRFVGHIGMANIENSSGELDNVMRGVAGGDPRLMYYSEVTLLDWCFRYLYFNCSSLRVLSYNCKAIALYKEVGYVISEQIHLRKREQDGVVFHDSAITDEANIGYCCMKMLLNKDDFYNNVYWLKL